MSAAPAYTVVVRTLGRPCLAECLRALAAAQGHPPHEVIVVDDRPPTDPDTGLPLEAAGQLLDRVRALRTGGKGAAAARNAGWRTVRTPWTVFLDDDVRVLPDWSRGLADDLRAAGAHVGGIRGRLRVPLPPDRRRARRERAIGGLENAAWTTADMAYRTAALIQVGGFEEHFPGAFREDAGLARRMERAGWTLHRGTRLTRPRGGPSHWWASLPAQRGDQTLTSRLYGPDRWARALATRGRLPGHVAVTGAALATAVCALTGRRRAAAVCAALWTLGTAEFAVARFRPGPRTAREMAGMLGTSVVVPPLAVRQWLRGAVRHRGAVPGAA
ncbi:glycosyltransferase family 2 protein [Streptomyces cellostaticus]|uniref:glycosyltransferase family 2 protein n=1 Tax=Streptomyces cellostaticus TaxID=67285 RepID=UPI002026C6DE|nr:glycosyltransferase [Streptomyces cellostaticus]